MGVEAELKWAPAEGWLIQGSVGFLDTEITDVGTNPTGLVEKGHELPNSPEVTGNLFLAYNANMGDGVLTLQTNMEYKGEAKTNVFTAPTIDEYRDLFQINARASYAFGSEMEYKISVYGENLTSEERCGFKVNLFAFSGTNYCLPNDGEAMYGISGEFRF